MSNQLMQKQDIEKNILFSITNESECRIYFKDLSRLPNYGKFVALEDFEDLLKKGMVRFLSGSKFDDFEESNSIGKYNFAKPMSIETLSMVRIIK